MKIEIRGRNTPITDALRKHVEDRFTAGLGKQVSDLARLEVELLVERNPAIADSKVAEATLHLKGDDPARARGLDGPRALGRPRRRQAARQVKRHREKRRDAREESAEEPPRPPPRIARGGRNGA